MDGKRQEVRSATSEMLAMPVVLKFLSSCVKKGSKWLWLCVNLRDHARGWWLAGPQREKNKSLLVCSWLYFDVLSSNLILILDIT